MARTRIGLANIQDQAKVSVTDNYHTCVAGDVTNGLVVSDFFQNADDSGILILDNSTGTDAATFTLKASANLAGTADGTNLKNFDEAIVVAAGKTYIKSVINSSRFGVTAADASGDYHQALNIDVAVIDTAHYPKIAAFGKFPQSFAGADLA